MKEKEAQELRQEIERLQPVVRANKDFRKDVQQIAMRLAELKKDLPTVDELIGKSPERQLEEAQRRLAVVEGKVPEPPRKAAPAFDVPKETSKVNEAPRQAVATSTFLHSDDFRSVILNGEKFTLTVREAQLIEILAGANEGHFPDMSEPRILDRIGSGKKIREIFSSKRRGIYKKLVREGERKGTFRLNI